MNFFMSCSCAEPSALQALQPIAWSRDSSASAEAVCADSRPAVGRAA
jgi:hypothetical protein